MHRVSNFITLQAQKIKRQLQKNYPLERSVSHSWAGRVALAGYGKPNVQAGGLEPWRNV